MTRIDFYQIESDESPLAFTCRLIEKAYRRGHDVFVQAQHPDEAAALDDLLWQGRPDRFIPHALLDDDTAHEAFTPIHIGTSDNPGRHHDLLINLTPSIPEFFSRFQRVAEVVPLDDNSREAAREHFRFYRDRGYSLEYHRMQARRAN